MEMNVQRRRLAVWVLILGTICRAIVGNYKNGCHQIFKVNLSDLPLTSYGPEYDPDDWEKCC